MKQPKKIIISLLVVVLLTFCTLTAFAAEGEAPFGIAVSTTVDAAIQGVDGALGYQKDSVLNFSITADVEGEREYWIMIHVNYDTDAFELTSDGVKFPAAYEGVSSKTEGSNEYVFGLNYFAYKGKGELASFSLKVKDVHADKTTIVVDATVYNPNTTDPNAFEIPSTLTGATTEISVHSYGEAKTVNPDCLNGGYTYRACTVKECNKQIVIARTEALGHKYGEWSLTTAPTADAAGLLTRTCERDAMHIETFELPKLNEANGYTYTVKTPEKCETPGAGTYTYAKDGQTFTFDAERAPHGHKYGAWVITTAPTVDAAGLLTKTCEHDATHTETFELPKLSETNGYTYAITTPEKCEIPGVGTYTYAKDGQTFTFNVDRTVLGHKYGAWALTTAPTADAAGLLTKTCEHDATHTLTFELPKLSTENGYTYEIITNEDCVTAGMGKFTYVKDGQTFTFDVERAALGHDESGAAATCTTDKVCARGCGAVLQAKLGHDDSGEDATMTSDKVCARGCGEILEERNTAGLVILIIVIVLVVAGGGFAAYWFLIKNKKADAKTDAKKDAKKDTEKDTKKTTKK